MTAASTPPARRTAAFFDVDGTLLAGVGFRGIIERLAADGDPALLEGCAALADRLRAKDDPLALTIDGYRLVAGQSFAHMAELGRQWFESSGQARLISASVARLIEHQRRGDLVAFVSGSWLPSLQPLADHLGVEHILCSDGFTEDGDRFTGETRLALVGPAKADAVLEFAAQHDLNLAASYAYGDDPSDEFLLAIVGNPIVVGTDERLRRIAHRHGWPVLTE